MTYIDVCKNPLEDPSEIIKGLLLLAGKQDLSDETGVYNARLMVGAVRLINTLFAHAAV